MILDVARITSPELVDGTVWITSAWRPGKTSLHSRNLAFDIRIKNVKGFDVKTFAHNKEVAAWAARMQETLGPDYDVVYHGDGKHNDHIHVEYDVE